MPTDRYWAWRLILITIVCLPLYLPAQKLGRARQSTPRGQELGSIHEPSGTTNSWNSSTRWNARLRVNAVHSSKTGWATIATPAAGHRFNNTFSMEASIPIYIYRLAESRLPIPPPDAILVEQQFESGDLVLSVHARFKPRCFRYQLTGSATAPSGDQTHGLSAGRVTFDVTNHLQRTFGRLTPTLTAGVGDSTALSNSLVAKTSTSLGPLAHFRAGLAIQLSSRFAFEADAVEQLPLGDQKIYTAKTVKSVTTTVVTGHTVTEHNGFNAVFDAIIDRHTVFSSYYNRSMRPNGDTVAVGLTYSLRGSSLDKDLARDDLFR